MTEVTEIWVWTVWEVTPVEAATEPAAAGAVGPNAEPQAAVPGSGAESPTEAETVAPETAAPEVAGYAVEAKDGHIGTVDEVSYDAGTGSIVVDTGHWIFGKKRMVPAGMIDKIDSDARVVTLSCTKAAVRAAPDYDPSRADDASHRDEVGEHYQAHRAAGDSAS